MKLLNVMCISKQLFSYTPMCELTPLIFIHHLDESLLYCMSRRFQEPLEHAFNHISLPTLLLTSSRQLITIVYPPAVFTMAGFIKKNNGYSELMIRAVKWCVDSD